MEIGSGGSKLVLPLPQVPPPGREGAGGEEENRLKSRGGRMEVVQKNKSHGDF